MLFTVRLLESDSDPEMMYEGDGDEVASFMQEILKEPLHGMTLEIKELCSQPES